MTSLVVYLGRFEIHNQPRHATTENGFLREPQFAKFIGNRMIAQHRDFAAQGKLCSLSVGNANCLIQLSATVAIGWLLLVV